jgi:hypothetical protein
MLEEMLKEDNSFIFKFKEDPDYLIDILEYPQHELCKYYNFTSFIFYKSIKGYDEDYFLREFYDLHKMN